MTTEWPVRPFHELPPPEGGAAAVRRAARRRRRRTAVASSGVSALVLVGGLALVPHGGRHPSDTLRVTDQPTVAVTAAPTASAGATASPSASPVPTASAGGAPVVGRPTAQATPSPVPAGGAEGYRTPDLTRTYLDRTSATGVTVCSGSASGTGSDLQYTTNWCQSAAAPRTGRGHDLVGEVCRDSSSDAQLSFGSSHEVELTVQDAAGRTVWTWSAGHAAATDPHALAVQREHCWDWTAPWTDVDAHGRPLPAGTYQLVVVPLAQELTTAPPATTSFTV